jgi:hypothetical protein
MIQLDLQSPKERHEDVSAGLAPYTRRDFLDADMKLGRELDGPKVVDDIVEDVGVECVVRVGGEAEVSADERGLTAWACSSRWLIP